MTLPAISFNKRRLLRFAWERLTAAREDALAIKSFSEPKDARFLGMSSVFSVLHWSTADACKEGHEADVQLRCLSIGS